MLHTNCLVRFLVCLIAVVGVAATAVATRPDNTPNIVPPVKEYQPISGTLRIERVRWIGAGSGGENEVYRDVLRRLNAHRHTLNDDAYTSIVVSVQDFPQMPRIESGYADQLMREAYRIYVGPGGVRIMGGSQEAVYRAITTLDQLVVDGEIPYCMITDWPDLPVRMLMIDPARQNEKLSYYKEFIEFAARYKINTILCHLTDDQTSVLYHEDYPELMHPNAWRPDEVRELVEFARAHYIELIPEIESLGHSRMFTRRADYGDYLHQTETARAGHRWTGTDLEGYTNVLCPASDKAMEYIAKMYDRAGETFDHPWLHIGCDEVDMTRCARCLAAYGELSKEEWIVKSLAQLTDAATARGKKVGVWGDMLLHYPEATDSLSTETTIIFDWHYRDSVTDEPSRFFKDRGFEVIASPALVCYPHMIVPDHHNYTNISKFTGIARDLDLLGVNTTIWIPTRYMSDVLWNGVAFAAAHAWGGSNFDEAAFFDSFTRDHFGSDAGTEYRAVWQRLTDIVWHRDEFNTSCWMDDDSLAAARKLAASDEGIDDAELAALDKIIADLEAIAPTVSRNADDWTALVRSAHILRYTWEHLRAASTLDVKTDEGRAALAELDARCVELIGWIEEDWDKNRHPDDPNKDGLYLTNQHLLYRFKQMHDFHQTLLGA